MKYYLISDNVDTLVGMRLAGIDGVLVHEEPEVKKALEQATMNGQQYISVEELQQASGVANSVFDKLRAVGALGSLPETSQVDLFSMM